MISHCFFRWKCIDKGEMDVVVILKSSKVDDVRGLCDFHALEYAAQNGRKINSIMKRTSHGHPGFPLKRSSPLGLAGPGVGSPERQFLHYLTEALKYCLVSGWKGCGTVLVRHWP